MEHYQAAFNQVLNDPDRFSMELSNEEQAKADKELPSDAAVTGWDLSQKNKLFCLTQQSFSPDAQAWAYVTWLVLVLNLTCVFFLLCSNSTSRTERFGL